MNFRQTIFERRVGKAVRKSKNYHNYSDIKSVLILFAADEQKNNDVVKDIMRRLTSQGRQVTALGYVGKKHILTITDDSFKIVNLSDFNLFGVPRKDLMASLESEHYDLLVDLHLGLSIPLQYLALYADADLKTGANQVNFKSVDKVLDFMIKLPEHEGEPTDQDVKMLFEEIIHYLQIIK